MRTRIKVCGMRNVDQVDALVGLGVDAIGIIFYQNSPRHISLEQALAIRDAVPAFVSLVGVFVDHPVAEINQISRTVGLDLVQLHGDQDVYFAQQLETPYLKAIRVESQSDIKTAAAEHQGARGYLLDSFDKNSYGGTGQRIAKSLLPKTLDKKFILAGGINPDNIDEILALKPSAIDINSGVERAPADKQIKLVKRIIQSVQMFDQNQKS